MHKFFPRACAIAMGLTAAAQSVAADEYSACTTAESHVALHGDVLMVNGKPMSVFIDIEMAKAAAAVLMDTVGTERAEVFEVRQDGNFFGYIAVTCK